MQSFTKYGRKIDYLIACIILIVLGAIVFYALMPTNEAIIRHNNQRLAQLYSLDYMINLELKSLPTDVALFPKSVSSSSCDQSQAVDGTGWLKFDPHYLNIQKYFPRLPQDPLAPKQCYIFKTSADGKTYKIEAALELDREGSALREMKDDGGINDYLLELGDNRKL